MTRKRYRLLNQRGLLLAAIPLIICPSGIAVAQSTTGPVIPTSPSAAPAPSTTDATASPAEAQAAPALAPEAPVPRDIVVTGSKIRGAGMANAMPVTTLSRAQIDKSGAATVTDLVNQLSVSAVGLDRQSNYTQEAYANLRGINRSYTLVLVNGHRWPGGASIDGNVDINTIPLGAVDHIDVLLAGGSVLYGSDAMVGVINIILRDKFNGIDVNTTYGQFGEGGGKTATTNVLVGHSGSRYSLLAGGSYSRSRSVPVSDYPFTATPLLGSGTSLYTDVTPAGSFQLCSIAGNTGTCPAASRVLPNGAKGFFTYNPGQAGTNWKTYSRATDGYNNRSGYYLALPLDIISAFGQGTFNVSDDIRFKLLASWTQTQSQRVLNYNAMSLGTGGAAGSAAAITIPSSSFYNPFGKQIAIVQRMATEAGMQGANYVDQTLVISPTVDGHFGLFGDSFDFEAGMVYGKTRARSTFFNQLSISRLARALGPSFKDTSGNIVCGTPGNVIADCVPVNLLGQGTITQAMLDYIEYGRFAPNPQVGNAMDLHDYFAQISSAKLFKLPAGNVGLSVGGERSIQSGATTGYGPFVAKDVLNNNRGIASGRFANNEVYAELNIPLLHDIPGIKQLDVDLAGRQSWYSFGAKVFNKQATVKWKVYNDLLLRGGYSTAFHYALASSISYPVTTYGVVSDTSGVPLDPCSFTTNSSGAVISNRYAGLTAAQQQSCTAAGVPAGGYDTTAAAATTIVNGGNALLQPEEDKYWTAGGVFSPSFIPRLDVTVDWWRIRFNKQIASFTNAQLVQNCFNNLGSATLCPASFFVRGTGGVLSYFRNSPLNSVNGNKIQGLDATIAYRIPTSVGTFRFNWANAFLLQVASPNSSVPNQNYAGTLAGSYGGGPYWKLRLNLDAEWTLNKVSASVRMRHFSSLKEQCTLVGSVNVGLCNDLGPAQNTAGTAFLPFMQGGSANILPAANYFDGSFTWNAPGHGRITVGVNNIFNKRPPYSVTSGGFSFNANYGIPDRYCYITLGEKLGR